MPLNDVAIKAAKPQEKPLRLFDERGLYLEVSPAGGKWWRYKYRYIGKEKRLSLGTYPEISLKEAREKRDEMRRMLANQVDPAEHRKMLKTVSAERSVNTFEAITCEWLSKYTSTWSPSHAKRMIRLFERDLFPALGYRAIAEITPPQLLEVLRRIEDRGALETVHRALGSCSQVFRYAVAIGKLKTDPTRDLRGALRPYKSNHFAAPTNPKKLGELLRIIESYEGSFTVACALKLAPLVFVRPLELRTAKWKEIDFDASEWRFTATKTDTPHIVPLSKQALAILKQLYPYTNDSIYVFPSARGNDRPMSDNAILAALRRLGVGKEEATGHGFRAVARTLLDEVLDFRPDIIEHQLAHAVKDPNGRAYNRTTHLEERRLMMQAWADYLDVLKN